MCCFGQARHLLADHRKLLDNQSVCLVYKLLATQWLRARLEFIGAAASASIAFVAVATNGTFLPAGWVAIALTACLELTSALQAVVNCLATLEGNFSSVERLQRYCELEQEAAEHSSGVLDGATGAALVASGGSAIVADTGAEAKWPSAGAIRATDVVMAYRDGGDPVLRGLSFDIGAGEKVGVVGRTGAGKSSIMIALFRVRELAAGAIAIDGVDIAKLGLAELRAALSIIPQDAVLFQAPLRFNLDPFDEHPDARLWEVA